MGKRDKATPHVPIAWKISSCWSRERRMRPPWPMCYAPDLRMCGYQLVTRCGQRVWRIDLTQLCAVRTLSTAWQPHDCTLIV